MKEEFNPVKEDKDGVRAKRTIWSTRAITLAVKALEEGRKLVANPFYEYNIKLLKGELVFKRTPEEIEEWRKCATDIIYFANHYCHLMTPEGIKQVTLRDYQVKYLKHLCGTQLSIYLACRQCGKCVNLITTTHCKLDDRFLSSIDGKLKESWYNNYFIKELDIYQLPLFELYNVFDKRLIWNVKYRLYKLLYKLICQKVQRESQIEKTTINV